MKLWAQGAGRTFHRHFTPCHEAFESQAPTTDWYCIVLEPIPSRGTPGTANTRVGKKRDHTRGRGDRRPAPTPSVIKRGCGSQLQGPKVSHHCSFNPCSRSISRVPFF